MGDYNSNTPSQQRNTVESTADFSSLQETAFKTPDTMADETFKKAFLDAHNEYRKKHQAPALTYSNELNVEAQKWADHLVSIKTLQHSSTKNGENLYFKWSSGPVTLPGKDGVESWYSEIKDYDFSNPGFGMNTGHFTQVVWKESKELGVGLASDGNNIFVVGQYSPAGNMNMEGYFKNNVLPAV